MAETTSFMTSRLGSLVRRSGLVRRATGWKLSRRGWVIFIGLGLLVGVGLLKVIHPFLALDAPLEASVLVVEGWAEDYALQAAAERAEEGGYTLLLVAGGPLERGAPLSQYRTYAELGAAVIKSSAPSSIPLQSIPAPAVRRDRTYASALAVRDWLEQHETMPRSLNVVTVGPHARRTRLLYRKAFGTRCTIGVIAVEDDSYTPEQWWRYSQGVRDVVGEAVAYVYARCLFSWSADVEDHPSPGDPAS